MHDRRNVEIKARLRNLAAARKIAARLATEPPVQLHQLDTYFVCSHGRLKLRETRGEMAQLIWYNRDNQHNAKTSHYQLLDIENAEALKIELTAALGVRCVVDKHRELFLWKKVRIHLDTVIDLGTFLEFEAVLGRNDSEEVGRCQVEHLSAQFNLEPHDLLPGSYAELLGAEPPNLDIPAD